MIKVSVITVNFNQPSVTEALLSSLIEVNDYQELEVIVVDNGSEVNKTREWAVQYPTVKFIRSEDNLGFAGGNNLGIKAALGDFLLFINNDTEVTAHLIAGMVGYMEERPKVGMLSPKIHYFDEPGIIQYAGYTAMNFVTARNRCVGQFEEDKGQYDELVGETGYIHGAAMMVRRQAIEMAGPMPENYFLYYEEFDWVEAIKRAGFEIHVNNNLLIHHKESVSVGRNSPLKTYFMNRNRILFVRRNATWYQYLLFCFYFMGLVMPRNIIEYIRKGQYSYIKILIRAMSWHLFNAPNSEYLGFTQRK
ncbi:hypothetical protein CLV98_11099 [Dyadobacter jejuensis]|uniref:Glycosyltransferase 2-like domain-containing protein n=1 Tax=Dyadobacter jejuensis TaxID=1082580 RepID=A0A316AHL9_9BACT|nr:glycosyltransferase family 2 protein [Dyadobacter jejuensis]PWJ56788.1 hypothetical protein CLV98_11099 [Dyadobacter jejuensis]